MEEVLSDLNFDEGMAVPIANLENKKLESTVSKCSSIYNTFTI